MICFLTNYITRVLSVLCLAFTINQLPGQIQHINFRHYSLSEGISSYKVVKVLQDRFGFIWIATQDGLNRFDGKDIVIYNKSALHKHVLAGSDITDMIEDTSRNILWVISSYGGLNGIDIKTGNVKYSITVQDTASNFSHGFLKCILLNKDELWIGTFNGITIYKPGDKKFENSIKIPFKKNNTNSYLFDINLLYKDDNDNIWVFVENYGLVIYSGKDHSVISSYTLAALHLPEEYIYRRFNCIQKTGQNKMLLATTQGIKKIEYKNAVALMINDEKIPIANDRDIRSLQFDNNDHLWFASGTGLFRYDPSTHSTVSIKEVNNSDQKKWLSSINSVFFDKQNNLWLGTLQGVAVAPNSQTAFINFFQSKDLKTKINRAYYIYPFNDSVQYVCAEDGFYRVDNFSGNITLVKGGMIFAYVFRHQDGNLIVSGENRVFVFKPPDRFIEIEKVYPELFAIKNEIINSGVNWRDSLVFFGSEKENGIYEWNHKQRSLKIINKNSPDPLKSNSVNGICKNKNDEIWILSDNSFAVYDPLDAIMVNYELQSPSSNQPLNLFFDMCEAAGTYWLASYGSGIIQLDKQYKIKNIISTTQGMANAGVYKLFPVKDSFLYATSNNGLCRINIRDLSISNYHESDGLHSDAFEEFCGIEEKGKIYAGGPNGFTIINTKYLEPNTVAPVAFIHRVTMQTKTGFTDTSDIFLKSVKIPSTILQSTVYFSGIQYSNPERIVFAYRIKQQGEEWITLGNKNNFTFTRLAPGTYTLQVKAANEDGVWSEPVQLELIFLPKWFQTWWFKILVLLFVAGFFYSLYKYRVGQLKNMLNFRTQISRDLHDEIGSTLTSINILSKVSQSNLESDKVKASGLLQKITEQSANMQQSMSDIVWSIRPDHDKIEDLVARMREYLGQTAEPKNMLIEFRADENVLKKNLSMELRKDVFLIFKEAVNNAVKYSKGKKITVFLGKQDDCIKLSVQDDGTGFDTMRETSSNGLKNMRDRAKEINGTLQIQSIPGKGTLIELLCPAT